jgi:hypothetical protein
MAVHLINKKKKKGENNGGAVAMPHGENPKDSLTVSDEKKVHLANRNIKLIRNKNRSAFHDY